MMLLSDANVLIDLGYVQGLSLLPRLGTTRVLSTVYLECEHPKQPTLAAEIVRVGIEVVEVERSLLDEAQAYPNEVLSLSDRQSLLYARDQGYVLLTGDAPLRLAADVERVSCHGTVWLVEQAISGQLLPNAELCRWLSEWPMRSRRIPKAHLQRLRRQLGC
ncbi:MAG: hypothetical protein ACK42I_06025 [Thermomicrobium sp.]